MSKDMSAVTDVSKAFLINFMQWNAQSITPKKIVFEALLNQEKIHIAILSETWLDTDSLVRFSNYNFYRKDRIDSHGGVAILVHKSLQSYSHSLPISNTGIELTCVKILNCKYLQNIISIYCPSSVHTTRADWEDLFSKFSASTIIAGDFNAHHSNWSCKNDTRGYHVVDSAIESGFVSLNNGAPTRIKLVNGTLQKTSPDVSFVSSDIAISFQWSVLSECLGSDHIVIKFTLKYDDIVKLTPKRDIKRANWKAYREYIAENFSITNEIGLDIQKSYDALEKIINESANKNIPTIKICTNPEQKFIPKPYWQPHLSKIVAERRLKLKEFRRNPIPRILNELENKIKQSNVEISRARSKNWHNFCNSIDETYSESEVWKKMNWAKGRQYNKSYVSRDSKIKLLRSLTPDTTVHLQPSFKSSNKTLEEEFTVQELSSCLKKKDTAPGADGITYSMIYNLPNPVKKHLLDLYNLILKYSIIPKQWRSIEIIPIPKPGTSSSSEQKLRPISLISCICKILHLMITKRLEWFVENNNIISSAVTGFRRSYSCLDSLTRLISYIQIGFSENIPTLACFIDIESAYNNVLIERTVSILDSLSIGSTLCKYIWNFLSCRELRVKDDISGEYLVRQTSRGLAQGDPMSPIVFNLVTHEISKNITNVQLCQYADDFVLFFKSKYLYESSENIQDALDTFVELLAKLGLNMSVNKTKICMFSRANKRIDIDIKINGLSLSLVDNYRYLGLWLDKKLLFHKHINEVAQKTHKLLNVIKILAGSTWGVHPKHLRRLYISLIRSRLDYGCFLYDSSSKSHVEKLDRLQNQALRIIGGFIRSTPIHVMESELCIAPLFVRRQYLAFKYCLKCYSRANNVTIELLDNLSKVCQKSFWNNKKKPLLTKVYEHNIKNEKVFKSSRLSIFSMETWVSMINTVEVIKIDLECMVESKKSYHPILLKNDILCELYQKYKGWHKIFTDGSKSKNGAGAAYYDYDLKTNSCFKIMSDICIMTAELLAISEAISYAKDLGYNEVVIFTDSKSALQHIARCASGSRGIALAYCILHKIWSLPKNMKMKLQWIPSHLGIRGNEEADRLARDALLNGNEIYVLPDHTEVLPKFKKKCHDIWKEYVNERSKEKGIWYRSLQCEPPHVPWFNDVKLNRDLIKIAFRLRSGHIPLNKFAFLMKKSLTPNCEVCQKPEDVFHILEECTRNDIDRCRLYGILGFKQQDLGKFHSVLSKPACCKAKLVYLFIFHSLKHS